jgi:hypothetical protein
MGKWILGGIALTVCSAVGVYFAACHAIDQPGSLVSCCTSVASQVIQATTSGTVAGAVASAVVDPLTPLDVPSESFEPIVIEDTEEQGGLENPSHGLVPVARGVLHRFLTAGTPEIAAPESVTILEGVKTQDFMPYADENATTSEDDECCEGCWLQSLVSELLEELAEVLTQGSPEVQTEEPASDETQENPSSEESADPSSLPNMQEDPYYHHHYPSCPYTGRCPYPGSYVPPIVHPVEPVAPPLPAPEAPKPPKKKFSWFGASTSVAHPEVDTMECRPTDLPRPVENRRPY